jgi:hypothetical protein
VEPVSIMDIQPDDTAQAPEPSDPETACTDTTAADCSELAWSSDTEPCDDEVNERPVPTLPHPWATVWGTAAAIVLIAATVAFTVYEVQTTSARVSAPSTTVTVAPPLPSTLDQWAPLPAPPAPAVPEDKDAQFLALMETQHLAPNLMDRIVEAAHTVCDEIAEGNTKAGFVRRILYSHQGEETPEQARFFVDTAVNFYCPQYAND